MNMDVFKMLAAWDRVMNALEDLKSDDETNAMMLSVLCMAIDLCAERSGMEPADLMDMLRPTVCDVNASLGKIVLN